MERFKFKVAVFILLEKDGKVLLARRFQTGWEDGKYNAPSGHVEENETPVQAVIRETKEEINVDLKAEDLALVHTMYFDNYINLYFKATNFQGTPKIMELNKCDDLSWFDYSKLPDNFAGHGLDALQAVINKEHYSEY